MDIFTEKLAVSEMKQKEKEAQVLAAEAEFNRLNRRVQELEEDLETTETKFVLASQKLDKAATTADDSDRMKKVMMMIVMMMMMIVMIVIMMMFAGAGEQGR